MASTDFADLYGLVAKAAQRDNTLAADLASVKSAVNEAYFAVCESGDAWDFLGVQGTQAMVVGQESYTYTTIGTSLSATVTHILDVGQGFASAPQMQYVEWEDYWAIKALNLALANGTPAIWTTFGDSTLSIWPKPSATTAMTILALKQATELSADADFPLIPLQMRRRLIVPGAAAILLRQDGGTEAMTTAVKYEEDFLARLDELRTGHALDGKLPKPPERPIQLPSGLLGASGAFQYLAQQVCHLTGMKPWIAWDLARAKEAVNAGYLAICDDGTRWDFLEATGTQALTAATQDYTYATIATSLSLTGGVSDIHEVRSSVSGAEMHYLDWAEFADYTSLNPSLAENPPVAWTVFGDSTLRIFPVPGATPGSLTVLVRKTATALSADADAPLIPADWRDRLLVVYAAWKLYESSGRQEEALREKECFDRDLDAFRKAHARADIPKESTPQIAVGLRGTSGTYLDLAQRACYLAGVKPWSQNALLRAKDAVNAAYLSAVTGGERWDFLEQEGQWTTTAGSDVYTYATIATAISVTAISEILYLTNDTDGGERLESMAWESLENYASSTQDGDSNGTPVAWAKWGTRLRLSPTPDAAYAIGTFVRLTPTALSADADAPLIPLPWRHRIIATRAAAEIARVNGADRRADSLLAEYQAAVKDFRAAHGSGKSPTLRLFSPTFASDLPGSDGGW